MYIHRLLPRTYAKLSLVYPVFTAGCKMQLHVAKSDELVDRNEALLTGAYSSNCGPFFHSQSEISVAILVGATRCIHKLPSHL